MQAPHRWLVHSELIHPLKIHAKNAWWGRQPYRPQRVAWCTPRYFFPWHERTDVSCRGRMGNVAADVHHAIISILLPVYSCLAAVHIKTRVFHEAAMKQTFMADCHQAVVTMLLAARWCLAFLVL